MLYFVTALYCEAEPIIRTLHLKKDTATHSFELFKNRDAYLILSNTGSLSSAVATTYLLTLYPPSKKDLLINLGTCASNDKNIPAGTVFLCTSVTNQAAHRCFYPDLLYKHPFSEAPLITVPSIISSDDMTKDSLTLYDMEASGFCESAHKFAECHQLLLIKIISDYGETKNITSTKLTTLIDTAFPYILNWLEHLHGMVSDKILPTFSETMKINTLSEKLFLSVTLKEQFFQLLHFYWNTNHNIMPLLNQIEEDSLQIHNKREGKQYFERFKSNIIHPCI